MRMLAPLSLAALALAQTPADPVIRVNVNLVQMDVTVTDGKGIPFPSLTAGDFEIYQDGKRQTITRFGYVTSGRPAVGGAQTTNTSHSVMDRARPEEIGRVIALVIDDTSISFESMAPLRTALQTFIRNHVEPGDRVAIVRTSAGAGSFQEFTSDKRKLLDAAGRLRYFLSPLTRVASFDPIEHPSAGGGAGTNLDERLRQMQRRMASSLRDSTATGTLAAMNWVVQGLHPLPGRKAAILFSEELTVYDRPARAGGVDNMFEIRPRTAEALRSLADLANRSGVVIHTIDPRGLAVGGLQSSDLVRIPERTLDDLQDRRLDFLQSKQGLASLAAETGGLFLDESNDLAGLVARAAADLDGYYLIGYTPDDDTFKKFESGPAFHRIEVKLNRRGLRVRHRRGFFGMRDEDRISQPSEPAVAALMSPFASSALRVKMTPAFIYSPGEGSGIRALIHVDPSGLAFRDVPADPEDRDRSPWRVADIQVVAVTFRQNGSAEGQTAKNFSIRARGRTLDQLMTNGLVQTIQHQVANAGSYQLRLAVYDTASGKAGTVSQLIDVPRVDRREFALSGLTLAARAWQNTRGVPGSPATRIFHPGEEIAYSAYVYNPGQTGGAGTTDLIEDIAILREGQEAQPPVSRAVPAEIPQTGSIVASGTVVLRNDLEPGEYQLRLTVLDRTRKRDNLLSRVIDFEVRKR